ncbi:hypothetical protein F443_12312, partial [Phytophthora nicotianae P1569]
MAQLLDRRSQRAPIRRATSALNCSYPRGLTEAEVGRSVVVDEKLAATDISIMASIGINLVFRQRQHGSVFSSRGRRSRHRGNPVVARSLRTRLRCSFGDA